MMRKKAKESETFILEIVKKAIPSLSGSLTLNTLSKGLKAKVDGKNEIVKLSTIEVSEENGSLDFIATWEGVPPNSVICIDGVNYLAEEFGESSFVLKLV